MCLHRRALPDACSAKKQRHVCGLHVSVSIDKVLLAQCWAHTFTQLVYSSLRLTFACTPPVPWTIRPGELDAEFGGMPAAFELAVGEAPQPLSLPRAGNL